MGRETPPPEVPLVIRDHWSDGGGSGFIIQEEVEHCTNASPLPSTLTLCISPSSPPSYNLAN